MLTLLEQMAKIWPLILAGITVGVWLVRLEAKVQENSKDMNGLGARVRDQGKDLQDQVFTLREKFAEVKGYLTRRNSDKED